MKPGFLNEITTQSEDIESFKQEKFVKVIAKKKPVYWIMGLVILVSLGLWFMMNQKTEVPNFVSWDLTDVNAWTQSHDIQLVYKGVYSPQTIDTVLTQDVEPGTALSAKSVVVVEVSQGVDPDEIITLPAFNESWDKTQLLQWLSESQIESYRFELAQDQSLAPNVFIAYSVSTTPFTRSDDIVFIVNQSATVATLIMPDLSTSTLSEIETWSKESNLELTVTSVFSDNVQSDKFVSQSVLPNQTIDSGSSITVAFSKGEAIVVADFKTMDATEAKSWAALNNLALSVESVYSTTAEGTLISQSIKKGTLVEAKTQLKVIYSLGNLITVGSYVNTPITALSSFIEVQNALGANLTFTISTQYSSSVAVNRIIAISVSDEVLARGSKLEVIVSLGALTKVPDFTLLTTGDYLSTYNALLNAAKNANVTIRITSIDDPNVDESNLVLTQSVASQTLCSSADIIDLILTY